MITVYIFDKIKCSITPFADVKHNPQRVSSQTASLPEKKETLD